MLNLIASAKALFPKFRSRVPGHRIWPYLLGAQFYPKQNTNTDAQRQKTPQHKNVSNKYIITQNRHVLLKKDLKVHHVKLSC